MKHKLLTSITGWLLCLGSFAQTQNFDVFTFIVPEFFTKTVLPSQVQLSLKNNDTSFCNITIYKSRTATEESTKVVMALWKERVLKKLNKAVSKPSNIATGQQTDGWTTALAIGNFYQNKKKCVVMLWYFRKENQSACVVFAFSDKLFKQPVELFSNTLHLKE
jgi:hypothetical protein